MNKLIVLFILLLDSSDALQRRHGLKFFLSQAVAAVLPTNGRAKPAPISSDDDSEEYSDYEGLDHLQLHPLLQVPCALSLGDDDEDNIWPIPAFLDTGAQRTVMSIQAAERSGFLRTNMDRRYAGGNAAGVSGSCAIVGRVPAGLCQIHLGGGIVVPSPAIYIIESSAGDGVDFLLGLDFLRDHKAVIDLFDEELKMHLSDGSTESVPFIRLRTTLAGLEESCDSDDSDGGKVDMSGM